MEKIVRIKKDEKTGEHYFDINDLADVINIELIESYSMVREGESFVFTFYDKDGNKINPKKS